MSITLRFKEDSLRQGQRLAKAQNRSFNGMMQTLLDEALAAQRKLEARQRSQQSKEPGDGR